MILMQTKTSDAVIEDTQRSVV